MIKLSWSTGFKRSYKKRIRNNAILKEDFWNSIEVFVHTPFHPHIKTHPLTGKLNGLWAFSVAHDCRVVFKFFNDGKTALLIDIGTHEEVY